MTTVTEDKGHRSETAASTCRATVVQAVATVYVQDDDDDPSSLVLAGEPGVGEVEIPSESGEPRTTFDRERAMDIIRPIVDRRLNVPR